MALVEEAQGNIRDLRYESFTVRQPVAFIEAKRWPDSK
jgi:hypothetical protein